MTTIPNLEPILAAAMQAAGQAFATHMITGSGEFGELITAVREVRDLPDEVEPTLTQISRAMVQAMERGVIINTSSMLRSITRDGVGQADLAAALQTLPEETRAKLAKIIADVQAKAGGETDRAKLDRLAEACVAACKTDADRLLAETLAKGKGGRDG